MSLRAPALALTVGLLLAACGPASLPPPDLDAGVVLTEDGGTVPLLELGTGTQTFAPLVAGQTVPVIAGPQGGFHIWAAVRTRAPLDPTLLRLAVKVKFAGAELTSTDYRVTLVKNGPYAEWYGMTALVPDPDVVRGKPTTVEVVATDSAGRTATDSRSLIPSGP
ncbi:MAG: hypothetical protein IAE78_13465 [Myxococcus sp.]|nr:hypothetical protein [Myxococcus sp.]